MELSQIDLGDFDLSELPAGKRAFRLKLFHFRDGTQLTVPVAVVKGKTEGPAVCIVAGQHGDEWNGPYIVHRLFEALDAADVIGTVVLIPTANPPAFIEKNRVSRIDGVDMNRVFQFQKGHRPTEQLAKFLFESIFSRCNHLIDLHSGGPGEYLPHAGTRPERLPLARSLGLGHIITMKGPVEDISRYGGSLVPACEMRGITGIVVEIGCARQIERSYAETGIRGLLNYLRFTGAMSGQPEEFSGQLVYESKVAVKSPVSGIFTPAAPLGSEVEQGELLGSVTTVFSTDAFEARAPESGIVLYIRREEMVAEGESLYHIAW